MTSNKSEGGDAPHEAKVEIGKALRDVLNHAESLFAKDPVGKGIDWLLPKQALEALDVLSRKSNSASTGFNNVITGLAIKVAYPNIDITRHQVESLGAPFNFRGPSETVVYPFLASHQFEGAKSGWQTRTFERPRAYTLDYPEKIAGIKDEFLQTYVNVQSGAWDAFRCLDYLFFRQLQLREEKQIPVFAPTIDQIDLIVSYLRTHFYSKYSGKGSSRLPVLALHAVYEVLVAEVARYHGLGLLPLKSHSAADAQTGACGDIEIVDGAGKFFEGVEVKHEIPITLEMVEETERKIAPLGLKRYYLLTTDLDCAPSAEIQERLDSILQRIGCQVIVNGVLPTIRYYLRLLRSPSDFFPAYAELLKQDKAIGHGHRTLWNEIISGKVELLK